MQNVHGCQETNETKNYIMKHKMITEMGVDEIRRELQESERSYLEEREEEELDHSGTIRDGEKKPNAASITEEETEILQHRNEIQKLKEKIESTYQVIQIEIDKRLRIDKLRNMFKLKAVMETANKATERILDGKDLSITELKHLIYAATTVITEEINGTGEYKLDTRRSKTPPWVRSQKN